MPTLNREEARALAGLRRLFVAFATRLSEPPADPEPAGLTLILKELKLMSDTFDNAMGKLSSDVAAQSTIIASATQAFRGLVAQLVAAEAAAKNAGATDAQVASVTALRQQLEANTASLAAAIPANTDASTTTTPTAPADPVTTTATPVTPPVVTSPAPAATDPTTSSIPASAPATPIDTPATPAAADAAALAASQAR